MNGNRDRGSSAHRLAGWARRAARRDGYRPRRGRAPLRDAAARGCGGDRSRCGVGTSVTARMDLTLHTGRGGVPRPSAGSWLEANVPRGLPSGDTREGFALHLEWERALFDARWAVVSWPEAYGGRDASPDGVADLRGGVLPGGRARSGSPRTASSSWRRPSSSSAPRSSRTASCPAWPRAEDLWCQGWSEPNAGSDLAGHPEPGACATTRPAAGGSPARRRGRPAARSAPTCSGCSAPTPTAERHRGLTYFLVPLDAPGVTVRGFGRLDGDEGFAEVFLDDVFVPDADVLGGVNEGWGVAMATTERRARPDAAQPGRFMATAARLVDLWRERGDASDPQLRDAVVRAWIDAEAYRWQTFLTVTRMTDGENARRGVEPDQGLLVRARRAPPRDRARAARAPTPSSTTSGVDEGLPVRAVGPDLRRHQRDPAQRDRRARARPAAT